VCPADGQDPENLAAKGERRDDARFEAQRGELVLLRVAGVVAHVPADDRLAAGEDVLHDRARDRSSCPAGEELVLAPAGVPHHDRLLAFDDDDGEAVELEDAAHFGQEQTERFLLIERRASARATRLTASSWSARSGEERRQEQRQEHSAENPVAHRSLDDGRHHDLTHRRVGLVGVVDDDVARDDAGVERERPESRATSARSGRGRGGQAPRRRLHRGRRQP
jgi:hypothetical protein